MGVGRLAPHRVRARYAQALGEIPLPVKSFSGIEPDWLHIIAQTQIGERELQFGVLEGTPRVWITLPEHLPPVLGYLTGIESGPPDLHITERDHLAWARSPGRAARIKREALTAWQAAQRECEG